LIELTSLWCKRSSEVRGGTLQLIIHSEFSKDGQELLLVQRLPEAIGVKVDQALK
jgi:hypothetical protein